ncbi:MAG: hypothetical protein LW837_11405, partial [Roseomonas sp.]|nr:hypothetical protein [Roseomonas sp.]
EKAGPRLTPDPVALDQALRLALDLAARIPGAPPPRAEALLTLPGVLRAETTELDEAAEEARRAAVAASFSTALQALSKARAAEGARLAEILAVLIDEIAALVALARDTAADQPAQQKARLLESLAALLEGERR